MRQIFVGFCILLVTTPAFAFTQKGFGTAIGSGVPIGHEWLTRRAAVELLLGSDPLVPDDPNDPRKTWKQGLAKNLDLSGDATQREVRRLLAQKVNDSYYGSPFQAVYDAIVGERWVDIGGFNVTNAHIPGNVNCWDAVAQEPPEIQYDHFMRRYDDSGGQGGVDAASASQQRFTRYFVDAAMAPPTKMLVWDGGGSSAQVTVDRNYFLMGRAAHLFEDSFSSEHTVRDVTDTPERVRQVKSYLCAYGSEQHTHSTSAALDFSSGDVIWLPGTRWAGGSWATYKPSFMKTHALVALEATKDLWAAFIRTMAVPRDQREQKARAEAAALVRNWLSYDAAEMRAWYGNPRNRDASYVLASGENPPGQTQSVCMQGLGVQSGKQAEKVQQLAAAQRLCLFNIIPVEGYSDLFDPQIHMPYNWQWVSSVSWKQPPSGWTIPARPADTGTRLRIRNRGNGGLMAAALTNNAPVRLDGGNPLDLILIGSMNEGFLRATFEPTLFLSYAATADGTVKLWNGTKQSSYSFPAAPNNTQSIMNLYWKQYIWNDNGQARLTKGGNPAQPNAQWTLERQQ